MLQKPDGRQRSQPTVSQSVRMPFGSGACSKVGSVRERLNKGATEEETMSGSLYLTDLTVNQYRELFDLAHLAISQSTSNSLFSSLADRLKQTSNIRMLTLGLYDPDTNGMHVEAWSPDISMNSPKALTVDSCVLECVWKSQRSLLIQDVTAEPNFPPFAESFRRFGICSYYAVPLSTATRKLGAMGFGTLHMISEKKEELEFLRRLAAIIAPLVESALGSNPENERADPVQRSSAMAIDPDEGRAGFELFEESGENCDPEKIVGQSPVLQELMQQVRTVASTDATVLLLGETGTGKELVARAIHRLSPRAKGSFFSVNCSAIPVELLESELFGHEKGAFTGAVSRQIGRWELADKSTLLLDEVGDLAGAMQPKLLRVLQSKQFERLGSSRTLNADVRLIAATNHDLHRSIAEGRFRQDLFYRLNVFPIYVPSLRARRSDIPELVSHFVSRYAKEWKKDIHSIPAEAMNTLVNWSWPGNVRELQNLMQRCVILSDTPVLKVPLDEMRHSARPPVGKIPVKIDRELIVRVLRDVDGRIGGAFGAAERLGIKRTTLYSRMKRLKITADRPST
jgi:formate hydrogenlyase transcriptional activator